MPVPLSILDLALVGAGETVRDSLEGSVALARRAEELGYRRVWYAEHHNMSSIASSATSVLIAHVAAHTSTIRLGSGGIMLPNHSPLVIAEQFGTLAALYPGRIDLGLGRAPGTDQMTARAMRRDPVSSADRFPQDVQELREFLKPARPGQRVHAVPGMGTRVPLWILGSSLFGAQLAAALGLPYAFASHFAPADLMDAIAIYRRDFVPSEQLDRPYVMPTIGVLAADTDREAQRLFTSQQQAFVNLRRGKLGPLPPPIDDIDSFWSESEKAGVEHALAEAVVGSADTVREGIASFIDRTQPDELMFAAHVFDPAARVRSLEIVADIRKSIG